MHQENCETFLMMILPNKYGMLSSGCGAIYFPLGNVTVSDVIFSLRQYSAIEVCTVMGMTRIGNRDHMHGNTIVGMGLCLTGLPWGWGAMPTVIPR